MFCMGYFQVLFVGKLSPFIVVGWASSFWVFLESGLLP